MGPWFLSFFLVITAASQIGCAAKQVTKGEPKRSETPLPGSNRIFPSQQSAQESRPGAPEAFPTSGTSGGAAPDGSASAPSPSPYGSPSSPSSTPYGSPSSPGSTYGSPTPGTAGSPSGTPPAYGAGSTPAGQAATATYFSVQLWASGSEETAKQRKESLQKNSDVPLRVVFFDGIYRVCAGEFSIEQEALALQRRMVGRGLVDAHVVSIPAAPARP